MFYDITVNIVSDFLTIATIALGGLIFYHVSRRRSLCTFFGVNSDKQIRIYISQINIIGDGNPDRLKRPFHGVTVGFLETIEARNIAELFLFLIPGLSVIPKFLGRLFLSDVKAEILPALSEEQFKLDSSAIALGTPLFNTFSKYIQSDVKPGFGFHNQDGDSQLRIPGLPAIKKAESPTKAVLARFKHNDIQIFYAAGFHDFSTAAATHYLSKHWRQLHKEFRASDFFVILDVTSFDYCAPSVVSKGSI